MIEVYATEKMLDYMLEHYAVGSSTEDLRLFAKGFDAAGKTMMVDFKHHFPNGKESAVGRGAVLVLSEIYKRLRKAEKNN